MTLDRRSCITPLVREKVRTLAGEFYVLVLALLTGVCTGGMALAFRVCVHRLEALSWLAQEQYGSLAWLVRLLLPTLAGLVVGLLLYRVVRSRGGHGVPAVIQAVAEDRPLDNAKMMFTAASSVLTLGSGGSAGPEGPIVELGAVAGSYVWRWSRLSSQSVQTLMGCGAAAGMAAVFNAPIGAVLFILEVVLKDFRLKTLAPVMLASVAASAMNQWAFGLDPAIRIPDTQAPALPLLLVVPVLALLCALSSMLSIQLSDSLSQTINHWEAPVWLKPLCGGLLVGGIGALFPMVQGVGYRHIESMMGGTLPVMLLLTIALAKILATSLTLASGFPGGAFAPALVIGAAIGASVGRVFGLDAAAVGLLGMAGLIAGTFRAPLTALLIMLKLGHYHVDLIVPLMAISAVSAWLVEQCVHANMYELRFLREGLNLHVARSVKVLFEGRRARDIMTSQVEAFSTCASLGQMLDVVSRSNQESYPILGEQGELQGVVTMTTLRQTLRIGDLSGLILACDLASPPPPAVSPNATLHEVWHLFQHTKARELLVLQPDPLNPERNHLLGRISHEAMFSNA